MDQDINIMITSNQRLFLQIYVQIKSMSVFFQNRQVHLYLVQHDFSEKVLKSYDDYCEKLGNITFHNIYIENRSEYTPLTVGGGRYPEETYFPLLCHTFLPEDMERILCIDAGDIMFYGENREIDAFYFCDFGNNLVCVTSRSEEWKETFTPEDMNDGEKMKKLAFGTYNAGSYMINLNAMREKNNTMKDLFEITEIFLKGPDLFENGDKFSGDQGIMTISYMGRILFLEGDGRYDMPFNFMPDKYDYNLYTLDYTPKIIHLHVPKAWSKSRSPKKQAQLYYEAWDEYYGQAMKEMNFIPEFYPLFHPTENEMLDFSGVSQLPEIFLNKNLVIFGKGNIGFRMSTLFSRYGKEIFGYSDNDKEEELIFQRYSFIPPESLSTIPNLIVVVAILREEVSQEICLQLKDLDVKEILTLEDCKTCFLT